MGVEGDRSSKLRAGLKKTALDAKVSAGAKITAKKSQQNSSGAQGTQEEAQWSGALCGICKNIPSGAGDPVMPSACEHLFCKPCLLNYVKVYRRCPVCKVDANMQPRTDIGIYTPLKDLTYEMRGIDLTTNVRQGDECDHPTGISHASVLDEPAFRPGPPPPKPQPRHTPRAVSRNGIPAPSGSMLGWGSLPPNPAPLVAGNPAFEGGCTIASPCGHIIDRMPKDNSGWKSAAGPPSAPDIDEETGAMFIDKSGDGIINADEMVFVEADQDEWQRAWVGARRAESKCRLAKLINGRVDLCYRKMATPYKPDLASRVAAVEGKKGRTAAGETIGRPAGSPPWKSPCDQLKIFQKKPKRQQGAPVRTPAAFKSPIKTAKPEELAEWNEEALCGGGTLAMSRKNSLGNELWRTHIQGDLVQAGALLSDYPFASGGPKGSGNRHANNRRAQTSQGMRSHSNLSQGSSRCSGSSVQRAQTPGEMWSTGSMRRHHSHGLKDSCNRPHTCASAQMRPPAKKHILPMPMARIPSRESGAKSGNRKMVLPKRTNQFKNTGGFANVWSQKGAVNPKPEYDFENPQADYQTAMQGFETNLDSFHQSELEAKIGGWLGVPKPASRDPNKPPAPYMGPPGEEDKATALNEEWKLYENLVPLVEHMSCDRAITFEAKVARVMSLFSDMDKGWDDKSDGRISLSEFEKMLHSLDVTISSDRMLAVFQLFDRDKNGYLDQAELVVAIEKLERHALKGSQDTYGAQALLS